MAYTLSKLIQSAAVKMGTLAIYKPSPVATAGDRSSITDGTLALTTDELKHGVAIITRDAAGTGVAPEGELAAITGNTGTMISVATNAFTVAVGAGDEVMVIRPKYPLSEWRRAANVALQSLGEIPLFDITTVMSTGLTEYDLPTGVYDPYEVWVQTNDDTDDFQWVRMHGHVIQPAAPGTKKVIRIPAIYVRDDYLIGIKYVGVHPDVYNAIDPIEIPIELAADALAWEMVNRGGIVARNQTQANKILAELNDAKAKIKIPNKEPGISSPFLTWGDS
jgi:hypothetical protein